jgi:hypothetical protein
VGKGEVGKVAQNAERGMGIYLLKDCIKRRYSSRKKTKI